ncbi:MAG: hypothetical protein KBA61_04355 [Spirochaetes bacterium]|nr:hypothetical protein [Spirochaetota bacterium]
MKVHTSLAGRLGITQGEIERLIALDEKEFDYREWLALRYAQDWVYLGGEEPAGEYMDDFRREYGARERKYILKLMRMMRFANLWNNTFHGRAWRPGTDGTCEL